MAPRKRNRSTETDNGTPLWEVTGITNTTEFDYQRGPVRAKEIHYRTIDGSTGSVVVPDTEFHPDKVSELIHDIAIRTVEISGLSGPTIPVPQTPLPMPFADTEQPGY